MRPIAKDVPTGGTILVNRITYLAERYDEQYDILPGIDVSLPEQDFACDLGIFPPRRVDWLNDLIRVEPPISAFEIVMPTEPPETLINAIRRHYFVNGVKSAWVITPDQKSISLLHPDQPIHVFTNGLIHDSASGLDIDVADVFTW
ncbi:hypothetical protein ACFSUS_20380 [Spirosoma soli]|uniref:Uma2 family endonuclease n=1 Tax=Spirosoma soli TaxID=1770529 RepID=A0ABW5M9E1_9BACT